MPNSLNSRLTSAWHKARVLQGIASGGTAFTGPNYVDIDLTRRCNLRCVACRYHSPYRESPGRDESETDISFSMVERLCRDLVALKTTSVIVIGDGEPLLHPDAVELIALIKRSGFHTTLLTNGTLLDREMIESLIAVQLDVLRVSLWATSPEQYERNYPGTRGDYIERVVNALSLVADLKKKKATGLPLMMVHHPISRDNYQTLDRMVDLAAKAGCDGVTFSPVTAQYPAGSQFVLSPDQEAETKRSLLGIQKRMESLGLKHNIHDTLMRYRLGNAIGESLLCYVGWFHAKVRADGTVEPCCRCEIPMGNLNETSFREIWNGAEYRDFRRQTITRDRFAALARDCPCVGCPHLPLSFRIHQIMRFFPPLIARRAE